MFVGETGGTRKGLLIDAEGDKLENGYVRIHPYDYGSGKSLNLVISPFGDGNVGIGTTDPKTTLHIKGSLHLEGTGQDISVPEQQDIQFGHLDGNTFTERMRIRRNGNVGIGTSSPGSKLEVHTDGGTGVRGQSNSNKSHEAGVYGYNSNSGNYGYLGEGRYGVWGYSRTFVGVYGRAECCAPGEEWGADYGVFGDHFSGSNGTLGSMFAGVIGQAGTNSLAGLFAGDVQINGTLNPNSAAFKIDHPLDPANKYLYHSFVESPDMMNIYNGNVVLDANGEAEIKFPDWFEALNMDFHYQLTAIGAPGPNLYIAEEISDNRFKIAGGISGMKVSWQVTGIRHDVYADEHRIEVEVEKVGKERGKYLSPKEHGMPETMGINYERRHRIEEKMKAMRERH